MINLWHGKPGRDGDDVPFAPIRDVTELADRLGIAEANGYFRLKRNYKMLRNEFKYLLEVKKYLSEAAAHNWIDRPYTPRKKKEN